MTIDHLMEGDHDHLNHISHAIRSNLEIQLPFLSDTIQHLVTIQNQPIRSLVLLLSTRMFSKIEPAIYDIGSVLEYLHTSSILHRNIVHQSLGLKSSHEAGIWGNETSVLIGDYLLSVSFQTLTRIANFGILEVISLATQQIAAGQILEISETYFSSTESHCLEILENKTASLFAAAAKSGAIWGGASDDIQASLLAYGKNIGMAVAIREQVHVMETPESLKNAVARGVILLPICYVIRNGLNAHFYEEKETPSPGKSLNEEELRILHRLLLDHQVSANLISQTNGYLNSAKSALKSLTSFDTEPLVQLANVLYH